MSSFLLLAIFYVVKCVSAADNAAGYSATSFDLPRVSFLQLLAVDEKASEQLKTSLVELGVVQITDIPYFLSARKQALADVNQCLSSTSSETEGVFRREMNDGSRRVSFGAQTVDGVRDSTMSHPCGDNAASLRSLIDIACRQVFAALDSKLSSPSKFRPVLSTYVTFSELIAKGSHLEHLHTYYPPSAASSKYDLDTILLHTDNGLMIAMTTGYYDVEPSSDRNGLYLQLSDGREIVKAHADDSSLILMMGEGAKKWLSPVFGKPFRAVPHALKVDMPTGSRTWFGKMYLPPGDAVIPEGDMPYSKYRLQETANTPYLPLACEYGVYVQSNECPGDQIMCWGSCQSAACGSEAVCMDLQTSAPATDPTAHCMGDSNYPGGIYCVLECPAGWNATMDYCYGDGASMSMIGFVSIVSDEKGTTPCVNLLFTDWTLNTETKFAFGCLGVLALGIAVQLLAMRRPQINRIIQEATQIVFMRRMVKALLFGIQMLFAYFLMLVAMTYNAELFSMVIAGLTIGYFLFCAEEQPGKKETAFSEPPADPCCPPEEEDFAQLNDREHGITKSLQESLLIKRTDRST